MLSLHIQHHRFINMLHFNVCNQIKPCTVSHLFQGFMFPQKGTDALSVAQGHHCCCHHPALFVPSLAAASARMMGFHDQMLPITNYSFLDDISRYISDEINHYLFAFICIVCIVVLTICLQMIFTKDDTIWYRRSSSAGCYRV